MNLDKIMVSEVREKKKDYILYNSIYIKLYEMQINL